MQRWHLDACCQAQTPTNFHSRNSPPRLQVLSQGSPPASPGGVAQLWLEGSVLLAAVGGLGGEALQQACGRLRTVLEQRLDAAVAAAAAAGGDEAADLAAWAAGGSRATGQGRLAVSACRLRLEALREEVQAQARCNLLPLQQLGAAAAQR